MTHEPEQHNGARVADYGEGHPFTGATIISSYSRVQAIDDGTLVECTLQARHLGFVLPLCITSAAWETFVAPGLRDLPEHEAGERAEARLRLLLTAVHTRIRQMANTRNDRVFLEHSKPGETPQRVKLWCHCGPGDDAEPVLTVMLEGED